MTSFIPIGENSTFDKGSEIVELFVRWNKNRYDRFNGSALLAWYSSMIAIYLTKTKEMLFNPKNIYTNLELLTYYRQNFQSFEDEILLDLRQITLNFEMTGTFNTTDISNIFHKIYDITCFDKNIFIKYPMLNEQEFPLTNVTGFFYYNTFLYALLNDIILLGFPALHTPVHSGEKLCPKQFVIHDMGHSAGFDFFDLALKKDLTKTYHLILTEGRSKKEKEMCIFSLWLCLHELFFLSIITRDDRLYLTCNMEKYINYLKNNIYDNSIYEFKTDQPYIWKQIKKYSLLFNEEKYSYLFINEDFEEKYKLKTIKLLVTFQLTLCELEQASGIKLPKYYD